MSHNVYADAGFKNPDVWLQKGRLVVEMRRVIRTRGLTPSRAAGIVGMPTAECSEIIKGHVGETEVSRLVDCLRRLGHDVEIIIRPLPENPRKPGTFVITPAPLSRTA